MELVKSKQTRSINRNSKKYFLDFCNKNVIGDKNTREWLIMKNLILNEKIIEGLLYNINKVVIKIGKKEDIDKEYIVNEQLQDYKGFVRYICKFSYQDDLNKYKHDNGEWSGQHGFCDINGLNRTNAIIMPYYELSSMLKYNWNKSNFDIFKKLLKNIVEVLFFTNKQIGFLHNDIHLDNIMLKKKKNDELTIEIIDFEKSTINKDDILNLKKLGINLNVLFHGVSMLEFVGNYDNLLIFQRKMRDPFENKDLNINSIYNYIDELTYLNELTTN